MGSVPRALQTGVIEYAQLWSEPGRLLLPVKHQRAGDHHQRGFWPLGDGVGRRLACVTSFSGLSLPTSIVAGSRTGFKILAVALLPPRLEQRQHLDGLAQPHVICQATTKAEVLQEVQPAQSLALVASQPAYEARGRIGGLNAFEAAQLFPHPFKQGITRGLRLRG